VHRAASYRREAAALERALGDGVVGIEHVGSTSVPGLAGRPILDLLVGLPGMEPTKAQLEALRRLGYGPPIRRTGRMHVKRGRPRSVTVHFAQWGGARWFRLIDIRDTLRDDPGLARRYAEVKASAAGSGTAAYAEAKRRFIEAQLRRKR
jgi:GrpB-like predicted nucleotidyltransferase (UPF0157 family)